MIGCDEIKKEENTGIIVKNEPVSDEEQEVNKVGINYFVKDEVEQSQDDNVYVNLQETAQRCAYCYECSKFMVSGPLEQTELDRWIEALGPNFANKLSCFPTYPVLCKKHFHATDFNAAGDKILKSAIPYPDVLYDRCYINPEQLENYQFSYCAYCGACLPTSQMKLVPRNLIIRGLWFRKLGDDFRIRVENEPQSHICDSHFPKRWLKQNIQSSYFALPLKQGEDVEYPVNCVYCCDVDHYDNMIPVPVGVDRAIWIDELGERFKDSLRMTQYPFICKSHFGEFEKSFNPGGPPIPLADEYIVDLEMKQLMSENGCSKLVQCVYCGDFKSYQQMTIVPLDEDILEKWTDVLGSEFSYNAFKTFTPWICKTHFNYRDFDQYRMLRRNALPIANDLQYQIYDHQKVKTLNNPVLTTCAYCGKNDVVRKFRSVVTCMLKRRKWIDILGKEFGDKCRRYSKSAICRSHFYIGEWEDGSKRYSTVPHPDEYGEDGAMEISVEKQLTTYNYNKKQDLNEMYTFGWETLEKMMSYNRKAITEQLIRKRIHTSEKISLKCIYCFNSPAKLINLSESSVWLRDKWDEYSKEFGIQFASRLRRSDLRESFMKSYPHLILCKRHINSKNEPIPDKNFHYSVDELLDHTYANFSHSYLWNGSSSQK